VLGEMPENIPLIAITMENTKKKNWDENWNLILMS
jgi:hypothetical protein